MEDYRFSVSICVYGGDNAEHFDTAMESIFNQTLCPDEVVLVVDGPVGDDIAEVIKKYEELYSILSVNWLVENVGHGKARRMGMQKCRYELIALMDADDICIRNRFERQIEIFKKNKNISVVGGLIKEFTESILDVKGVRVVPEDDSNIKLYMKKRCPMNQVTVMFKKRDILEVGGYIDWYCEEDYYLWIRLALANKIFYNIQDNLVYVRVGEEMYQRRGGIKYFKSEAKLQKYMLDNKIINIPRYIINVTERLILQVIMPNKLRSWIFKQFARENGGVVSEQKI